MSELRAYLASNPDGYELNEHGLIRGPGKMEGEPLYAVYFFEQACSGFSDESIVHADESVSDVFLLSDDDRAAHEDLAEVYAVSIHESDSGFVDCELLSEAELNEGRARIEEEAAEAAGPDEDAVTSSDHCDWYQYGKLVLSLDADADHVAELRAWMEREKFWPDAWWISDHGNAHRIDLSDAQRAGVQACVYCGQSVERSATGTLQGSDRSSYCSKAPNAAPSHGVQA